MPKRVLFRATKDTRLWKNGQELWEIFGTGALAAQVMGRWRGTGRWIRGWVHWEDPDPGPGFKPGTSFHGRPDARFIGVVDIPQWLDDLIERRAGHQSVRSSWSGRRKRAAEYRLG